MNAATTDHRHHSHSVSSQSLMASSGTRRVSSPMTAIFLKAASRFRREPWGVVRTIAPCSMRISTWSWNPHALMNAWGIRTPLDLPTGTSFTLTARTLERQQLQSNHVTILHQGEWRPLARSPGDSAPRNRGYPVDPQRFPPRLGHKVLRGRRGVPVPGGRRNPTLPLHFLSAAGGGASPPP